jgi:hypothetical protein
VTVLAAAVAALKIGGPLHRNHVWSYDCPQFDDGQMFAGVEGIESIGE